MTPYQRILQEAVDEACAAGADIVHDPHSIARWAPQQHRIWVRLSGDGRGGVSLDRLRHWSEGYSSYGRRVQTLSKDGSERLRRLIGDEMAIVTRLQKRDMEAIGRTGSRYEPCPSTLSCHPVGLALALHAGYRRSDMSCASLEQAGDEQRAIQDTHDARSRARIGQACLGRVRIRRERVHFRDIECPGLTYTDLTRDGAILKVACSLTETAMAALPSLSLHQIVDHPALDGVAPVGVRKIVRDTMGGQPAIAIHLKSATVPLVPQETIR